MVMNYNQMPQLGQVPPDQQPMPISPSMQMGMNPGPIGQQSPSQQMGLNPGALSQASLQQPTTPKMGMGGMFGSGHGAVDLLSSLMLNYGAAQGNPLGTAYVQGQARKQQMALEQQQYEARQQSELQRNMAMYQFQMQNPNGEMDQAIRQAGLDPHSPQAQAMYAQRAQTLAAPLQAFDYNDGQGNITKQFFRPGPMSPVGGPAGAPPLQVTDAASYAAVPPGGTYTTPDGHTRQKPGGQTPPASGTFHY